MRSDASSVCIATGGHGRQGRSSRITQIQLTTGAALDALTCSASDSFGAAVGGGELRDGVRAAPGAWA